MQTGLESFQLFGGCPPGTTVPLDTHRLHYSEITVKSAYHHRPATFERALTLLASGTLHPRVLLSAERPLAELEAVVERLQRPDVPLDEAVKLYRRGTELAQQTEALLADAELQVQQLSQAVRERFEEYAAEDPAEDDGEEAE